MGRLITGHLERDADIWRGESTVAIAPHDGALTESADWGNLLTTLRIACQWLRLNSDQAGRAASPKRIGSLMRRMGWRRVQQRVGAHRVWIWLPSDGAVGARRAPIDNSTSHDMAF